MFDKIMEHKGFFGLILCGIGIFASEYFNLINSIIFFGFMGPAILVAICIAYVLE